MADCSLTPEACCWPPDRNATTHVFRCSTTPSAHSSSPSTPGRLSSSVRQAWPQRRTGMSSSSTSVTTASKNSGTCRSPGDLRACVRVCSPPPPSLLLLPPPPCLSLCSFRITGSSWVTERSPLCCLSCLALLTRLQDRLGSWWVDSSLGILDSSSEGHLRSLKGRHGSLLLS